jgi:hypothetical protein
VRVELYAAKDAPPSVGPINSTVDLKSITPSDLLTGHNLVTLNSVEVNILFVKRSMASPEADIAMLSATVAAVVVTAIATRISYYLAKSQSYPEVIVYTEHDLKRTSIITLVIKNVGRGAAYNVRFYPSEPLPARAFGWAPMTDEQKNAIGVIDDGPLIDGIPFLQPGGYRVIDWGQYGGLRAKIEDRSISIRSEYYAKNLFGSAFELLRTESHVDIRSYAGTNASDLGSIRIKSPELESIKRLLESVIGGRAVRIKLEETKRSEPDGTDNTGAAPRRV